MDYNLAMSQTGLYIHTPFCRSRCHYCNFLSVADPSPQFRARFFRCLGREMENAAARHGRLEFGSVYFGGGTPSLMTVEEMTGLTRGLCEWFTLCPDAEVTCEWNPGDEDSEKIEIFRVLGVNRISLGVQSFQDHLLTALGRRHSTRDTLNTVQKIRKSGINNISFDLMLRIPGQTAADFRASLQKCVELGAAQVSLYDLEVHDKTLLGRLRKEGRLELPSEEEHAAMYRSAIETLTAAGYEHYEISNFARPGFASRHNLVYWNNGEYLGLGPGAFSYLNGVRYQYAGDVDGYLEKCGAGDFRNDQEDVLSAKEKETETFVMKLRLREGVSRSAFPVIFRELAKRIDALCGEGCMKITGDDLCLTDRGKAVAEEVFSFLLQKDNAFSGFFL